MDDSDPDSAARGESDDVSNDALTGETTGVTSPATVPDNVMAGMVRGRLALLIVFLMILLADATIYHARGFSGPAAFFVGATALLFVGIPRRAITPSSVLLALMMMLLSFRLASNGWGLQVCAGLWLLHGLTLAFRRQQPFVLETLIFAAQVVPGGYDFFQRINERMKEQVIGPAEDGMSGRRLEVILPLLAALLFGGTFVMANPDMVTWVSGHLGELATAVREFLFQFSPYEIAFWCAVAWATGGLLRPITGPIIAAACERLPTITQDTNAPLYAAFRNTLLTVIALFSAYLVFEFNTLWFREFPEGFYYAGYAHEGAAWLTVALGLATLTLSLIFRGRTLSDPRLRQLTRLSWGWSALNLLLAAAVYHRMYIYIEFNGMTRMRTVAMLGITSVVGGFLLVLVKINSRRNFLWLIRRQLWVLGLAVFVYAVLPVDVLIHRYNVAEVMSGNLPPVVQITGHEVDDECLPVLLPLTNSEDALIANGMKAFLAARTSQLQAKVGRAEQQGWTAWQRSQTNSLAILKDHRQEMSMSDSTSDGTNAFERLQNYAYENWW